MSRSILHMLGLSANENDVPFSLFALVGEHETAGTTRLRGLWSIDEVKATLRRISELCEYGVALTTRIRIVHGHCGFDRFTALFLARPAFLINGA